MSITQVTTALLHPAWCSRRHQTGTPRPSGHCPDALSIGVELASGGAHAGCGQCWTAYCSGHCPPLAARNGWCGEDTWEGCGARGRCAHAVGCRYMQIHRYVTVRTARSRLQPACASCQGWMGRRVHAAGPPAYGTRGLCGRGRSLLCCTSGPWERCGGKESTQQTPERKLDAPSGER